MLQLGAYIINPLVSGYAVSLGATVTVAGFLAGLNATTSVFARSFSGFVSDRFNKKSLLIVATVLFAVSAFGCACTCSLELVGLFRILQGIAFALKSAAVVSLAAFVVPRSLVGSGVGLLGLAYTAANALGPSIGSYLADSFGYRVSFTTAAALMVVGLLLAVLFKTSTLTDVHALCPRPSTSKTRRRFSLKQLFYLPNLPLTLSIGFISLAQGATVSLILLVGGSRGIAGIALYFTAYALTTLVSKPVFGRVSDRHGIKAIAIPLSLIAALAMILLAFAESLMLVMFSAVLFGIGQGSAFSSFQAESVRNVEKNMVGRAANTFYLGPDIGMGAGPLIGGFILQIFGGTAMFLVCSAFILIGLMVFCLSHIGSSPGPANHAGL
jgi:MFS family permease